MDYFNDGLRAWIQRVKSFIKFIQPVSLEVSAILVTCVLASFFSFANPLQSIPCNWLGPDNKPLPFKTYAEMEEFLVEADVLSRQTIPTGVTKPEKLLLEKDDIKMHAIFRTVDVFKQQWMSKDGMKLNFRDHYRFERAAYELGKLLGINNIPPVVLRTIGIQNGSLQAWVEGSMTEETRMEQRLVPPRSMEWIQQLHLIRLFDNLIYNDDRNQGNILIDKDWRLWMIDATRAFRIEDDLMNPDRIRFCPREFYYRLKAATEEELEKVLKDTELLTPGEFKTLLKRRKKLLNYLAELIQTKGEDAVLY